MELNVNYEELKRWVKDFEDQYDLYYYMKDIVDYLFSHNRNYYNEQFYKITELKNIIDCMSIKEK